MSKRDSKLLIRDILISINKIKVYTENKTYESFMVDELVKDAVVRNIEIIGEASNRIPDDLKSKSQNIPWSKLRGIRNRIVHDYFGVDYSIIWFIIENELIPLETELQILLSD
ncbi:MAG: DUF86 domain-containing protein [Melioribacteraceae bacterium]|nr:DUF86 domain-containing protein [Melioribacteraceae bacterium]